MAAPNKQIQVTIDASVLKKTLIYGVLLFVSCASLGMALYYRDAYQVTKAELAHQASLVSVCQKDITAVKDQVSTAELHLVKAEEQMKLLQVQASSSQDAATSALSQAESAKAEAQRKSTEAQSAQAEAEKQKGIATQKSQAAAQSEQQKAAVSSKLSTCQYYLNLAAQLTSLLSQQKVLYKAANSYVAKTVSDVLYGDYTAAKDDIDQAGYYLSAAASMDNQVNALLNQFQ